MNDSKDMTKIKMGDLVILKISAPYPDTEHNPFGSVGRVFGELQQSGRILVRWSNGNDNDYDPIYLTRVGSGHIGNPNLAFKLRKKVY